MHVGHHLATALNAYGVRTIFGVPGGQTAPLYDGIGSLAGSMRHVLMHDERSAIYAADGYARYSQGIGVCDATVGPGATNLVSGLAEAYNASVPIVAIVADIPRPWERHRSHGAASQGMNQRAMLERSVKLYARVEIPENLDDMLDSCVRAATSGRPGPTILEIPDDVFSGTAAPRPNRDRRPVRIPRQRIAPDAELMEDVARAVKAAHRPIIIAGGGAKASGAGAEILRLANLIDAPVATTLTGKGTIDERDPRAISVIGSFGIPTANAIVASADLVILVGTKAGQGSTMAWNLYGPDATIVQFDIDPGELGRNVQRSLALQGDARTCVRALVDLLRGWSPASKWDGAALAASMQDWWDTGAAECAHPDSDLIKPQRVIRELGARINRDDAVVADASLSSGWAASRWRLGPAGHRFFAPRGLAGLGWGLPASVGVAAAKGDLGDQGRVICLSGDGAWSYSMAELETAQRIGLPILAVVLNNSVLGWTKHTMQSKYAHTISQDFCDIDFARAAAAMGVRADRVSEVDHLAADLDELTGESQLPAMLEVRSCPQETPVLRKPVSPASTQVAFQSAYQ